MFRPINTTPKTTRPNHQRIIVVVIALIALLSITAYRLQANDEAPLTDAEATLEQLIANIEAVDHYRYTAQMEQTLIPRAITTNIGKSEERIDAQIIAEYTAPDHTALDLRFEGGGDSDGFTLEQEGDKTYVVENGERTQIENPVDSLLPTGDFATYLRAATNVVASPHPDFPTLTILAFDIDGKQYVEQLRAKSDSPNMPVPVTWSRITGHGELWVRESGYPLRQILDFDIPKANQEFDIETHVVIDYQFNAVAAGGVELGTASAERITQTANEAAPEPQISAEPDLSDVPEIAVPTLDIVQITTATIVLLALVAFIVLMHPPRWLHRVLPIVLAFTLGFTPLLQGMSAAYAEARRLPTLAEALDLVPDAEDEWADSAEETQQPDPFTRQVTEDQSACGTGDRTIDTDQDGTTDFVEICLGTNPYSYDTDGDTITDTLEINGFTYGGHTFYSNPIEPDTNGDGAGDGSEWPAPHGYAPSIDIDEDGVPNLWDEDNDGDGVRDGLDLDPEIATNFDTEFSIQTTRGGSLFDGYQIFDIQVQPKNKDHLRYGTTKLDWRYDEEGNIQDLDDSRDDVSLEPYLLITSPHIPNEGLRKQYGIRYEYDVVQGVDSYSLYIPVRPLSTGGNIVAFQARIGYGPDEIDEIDWQSIELIWMVAMEVDIPVVDDEDENEDDFVTSLQTIATYQDEFRITGVEISTNTSVDVAALGMSNTQGSELEAARMMTAMEETYLSYMELDLDEIERRFSLDEPSDETWGFDPDNVIVRKPQTAPEYLDAVPLLLGKTVHTMLSNDYTPTSDMVSVILATDGQVGTANLSDVNVEDDAALQFNIGKIPQLQIRSLSIVRFTHDGTAWASIQSDQMADALAKRYGNLEELAEDLNQIYPDISRAQMQTLLTSYYGASSLGSTSTLRLDGISLVDEYDDFVDDAKIAEFFEEVGADNVLEFLLRSTDSAEVGGGLLVNDTQSYFEYGYSRYRTQKDVLGGFIAAQKIRDVFVSYSWRFGEAKYAFRGKFGTSAWKASYQRWYYKGIYYGAYGNNADEYAKLKKWQVGKKLWAKIYANDPSALKVAKYAKYAQVAGLVVDVIAFGLELLEIWITYASFNSIYDYEKDFALGYAVTATIYESILFLLGLVAAIGAILAIFSLVFLLIDTIASWARSDFRITREIIKGLTKLHISVHPITRIHDFDYRGFDIDNGGILMAGDSMTVEDEFTGVLERTQNYPDEIAQSYAYGWFEAQAGDNIAVETEYDEHECNDYATYFDREENHYYDGTKICRNLMRATFTFEEAGINQQTQIRLNNYWKTRYKQCGGSIFFTSGEGCTKKTEEISLPGDMSEPWGWISLPPVDVLPATVSEFWNWSELDNQRSSSITYHFTDRDSDGIIQKYETKRGTDPNGWDSDGDGLSDQFEKRDDVDSNNLMWDTDGDGLNDGLEYRIGTKANDWDSDDDGLSDGQEWFHWNGSEWTGGGWYVTIDGVQYWTFSQPIKSDEDGDYVGDLTEFRVGVAPIADNLAAPQLELVVSQGDYDAVYVRAGDTVTATIDLYNVGTSVVTDTLSLCYPAGLTNVQITSSGDSAPVQTSDGDCHYWDFGNDYLRFLQTFRVEMSATAGSETMTGTISAELPYVYFGKYTTFTRQAAYNQDNTAPQVEITHPISRSILIGDYYVMGGYAEDADTWVDRIEVTVPTGTYTATKDLLWSYQWELPDDGIISVHAIAYDHVGNASDPFPVEVTVDSLAPIITSNLANNATVAAGESYSDTVSLGGDVTDNYAGLRRVQMQYGNQPWRTLWSTTEAPLSTTWNGEWQLPALSSTAQGEHNMRLRAYDTYGNIGYHTQTVFVDLFPPTAELTNRDFIGDEPKHVPLNVPLNVYGVANDAGRNPTPPGPVELEGTLNSIEDATVWLQPDSHLDNDAGVTMAWIGDQNGDRLGDLAIGFPAFAGGRGKVVVISGEAGDWPIPNLGEVEQLAGLKPSFVGIEGAGIGSKIEPVGDFDGDGFEEFLIDDVANNRIFLIRGKPSGFGLDQTLDGTFTGYWTELVTTVDGESISAEFSAAGDVNNDGFADILVSTTGAASNTVYLLLGGRITGAQILNEMAGATLQTSASTSVGHVGDVNGDFIDDFAIAINDAVHLFLGGTNWATAGLATLDPASASGTFAVSEQQPTIRAAGDLNGDGIDDFVYSNGATPVVVFGNSAEIYTTQTLSGYPVALNGFVAAVGDTDKDGLGDLLVGNVDGDAYLLLGGALNTVAATIEGVASAASAPYTKGADWVGDGSADLAIVPSAELAGELGYILDDVTPDFISRSALPQRVGQHSSGQSSAARRQTSGDVTVGAADADYSSIQAAIDSGASRVLINPGVYQEKLTLASNVIVAGSGPGLTILTMPVSETVLVEANGISNAALLNVTLQGNGSGTGIHVSNGTTALDLERTVIQDMALAVAIEGATSDLDLKNNTIIGNVNGISATGCATFDMRNTMLVYNSGTALAYEACAAVKRHEFNLYYANGTDMTPNDPGGGELFSNPLFESYGSSFAVTENSPLINTGSPGDSVPPGAGSRIDIGHIEQSGAGYVASHSYCSTCDNDGLIWGVNAFDTIQGAVDAAEQDMLNLLDSDGTVFTVGVDEGVYNESVGIEWNLQLVGSNANKTTIQGVGGPAVTLSNTIGTKVAGFTLIGGGANPVGLEMANGSSMLHVTHNLFKNNTTGLLVNDRSSGRVEFNTFISNTTAIHADQQYNWVDTVNNLISGNGTGLLATNSAAIYSNFNLLWNSADFTDVITGPNDILGVDPLLTGEFGYLTLSSPAVDAAEPFHDVPLGGGLLADIGWHELTLAPLSILMGQADGSVATESYGVGSVEYAIVPVVAPTVPVTATLPSSWTVATLDSPGEKLSYWNAAFTPAATGFYRIYSRATDGLGNTETDSDDWYDGAFYVDDGVPAVSMLRTELYEVANNSWLRMTAVVTDYIGTSFDIDEIYFTVDGVRHEAVWALNNWEADGVTGRTFAAVYRNSGNSSQNVDVRAFAVDGAGQMGSSTTLNDIFVDDYGLSGGYVDNLDPYFSFIDHDDDYTPPIASPGPFNDIYTGTVQIGGTVIDPGSGSGINGVQISFDGGLTWDTLELAQEATVAAKNNTALPYDWPIPMGLDATTVAAKLRVFDFSGNSGVGHAIFTVDTGAPRFIGAISLDSGPAQGAHLDRHTPVTFSWPMPLDGSNTITHLGEFGQQDLDSPPTVVLPDNSRATTIRSDAGGAYYAKVGAEDEAGNIAFMWVGPWYTGQVTEPRLPWLNTVQSTYETHIDGIVDVRNQEYLTQTEWLDDDDRPLSTQSLYSTWDGQNNYLAWQGADWSKDGTLWVYYDLLDGGSTSPVTGSAVAPASLPFEADVAITTSDGGQVTRYEYNGSAWVEGDYVSHGTNTASHGFEYVMSTEELAGDTSLLDNHRMLAFAVNDAGEVWSAFPISNNLDGAFDTYFDWNITESSDLLKLPHGAQLPTVGMNVASEPFAGNTLTHGDTVTYSVTIVNRGDTLADSVQLQFNTDNTFVFGSVSGASCNSCATAQAWLLDVQTIAPHATQQVTVVGQLDNNLSGSNAFTTTVALLGNGISLQNKGLVHVFDITRPTVTIARNPGQAIGRGAQVVLGEAYDGGSGLASVEVSIDGSTWQTAMGTTNWEATVDFQNELRSTTATVYARATDMHGLVGSVVTQTLFVDDVAPIITPTVPISVGNSTIFVLAGAAFDPAPMDAEVEVVEVQFGDDSAEWQQANTNALNSAAAQLWNYGWALPDDDYVTHTVRYRATDYAGNTTTSAWYNIIVDTVAPAVAVTQTNLTVPQVDTEPAIYGSVSDGSQTEQLTIMIYPSTGAATFVTPTISNGNWAVTMTGQPLGTYKLFVLAEDDFGNEFISAAYEVEVTDTVPSSVVMHDNLHQQQNNNDMLIWNVLLALVTLTYLTYRQKRRRRDVSVTK